MAASGTRPADGAGTLAAAALALLLFLAAVPAPAAAAGQSFEVASVVERVKRDLVAVADAPDGGPALRLEEVQLDLDLVELSGGKSGPRLVVPGLDFSAGEGGKEAAKPVLRRRLVLDLTLPRDAAAATATDPATGTPPPGALTQLLAELTRAARAGVAASPAFEAKRIGIDLEFALERDGRGLPAVVVFAHERRIEARNVHKLRLKLSAKER